MSTENLIKAIHNGDLAGVGRLIREETDVNAKHGDEETPVLMDAIWMVTAHPEENRDMRAQREGIVLALLDAGADPNAARKDRDTSLIWAAMKGQTGIVQALIDRGTDLGAKGFLGKTALDRAAEGGHAEVIEIIENHRKACEEIKTGAARVAGGVARLRSIFGPPDAPASHGSNPAARDNVKV